MKLTGRVAIVTGGASGIGKAIAARFLEAGADGVVLADINGKAAQDVEKELARQYESGVLAVPTDVTQPQGVSEMVDVALDRFGRVDILVNNAGICPVVPWERTTVDDWNQVLAVNVTGGFNCTKAVIPIMCRQKHGRILYISSAAAFLGSLVAHVAYGVSKAGMIALMKSVAKEFGGRGINANAIAPGTIDTPMTDSFGGEVQRRFVGSAPLERKGSPREVADAALFLVSSCSGYVNGATLHVNGGSLLV